MLHPYRFRAWRPHFCTRHGGPRAAVLGGFAGRARSDARVKTAGTICGGARLSHQSDTALAKQVDTLKAAFAEQHAQSEQAELERQERLVAVLCERISSELETRLRSDNQRALAVTEKALQHMSNALAMSMQEAMKTSKAHFTQQAYAALSSEVRHAMRPPMRTPMPR